ncbi:hypothetical protein D3880_13250 [Pseudomonas cavernae]|uniref:Uncharacterized protein n=1 Tax=Pseudomonas cavernae TaxID=2320867 RepID=A0A385Z1Y8_9PSED|nr:cupin domain-containing protein [Pseudomonas cavernae]AYC33255.1 hypothetical protein D3880_13250 [Pseudomonas cavernae]
MQLDPIAVELSRSLKSARAGEALAAALVRVERALLARPDQPQAWEPLPLNALGFTVPTGIQSCWIFVLRAGATFGAERHPNSHQRTLALSGSALFEVFIDGAWCPWPLSGGVAESESGSAISIPPSVWHRIKIGPENFMSVSFHTAPAERLIEETPVGDDLAVTKQRLYHA